MTLINYNLVSAVLDLYPDNSYPGRLELILNNAKPLFELGVSIVIFVDEYTDKKIPDYKHIIKHKINVLDFPIYTRGLNVRLPNIRCNIKDTAEFIAFGHLKMELMEIAREYYSFNDYMMWIDAGISKVVAQDVLNTLRHKWFRHKGVIAPGIQPKQILDFNRPMWRFCGGVFVMERETDLSIFKKYIHMMYDCGFTTWEGNLWAVIEQMRPDIIEWRQGHFNNSIIECL